MKDKISGLILLYPAFIITETINSTFERIEDIPDQFRLLWMTLGKAYAEPLIGYDIYDHIDSYSNPVLIIHGTSDSIVPIRYSERALEVYEKATLIRISGAGHGFSNSSFEQAMDGIEKYLEEVV